MKLFNITAAFLFVVALTVSVNAEELNTSSQKEIKTAGLFQNDNFYRGRQYNSYQTRYAPSRNRSVGYRNSAYGRTSNCANGQCNDPVSCANGTCNQIACANGTCGHSRCANGRCGLTASCANGTCGHLNKNCANGSCYRNSSYNTNYNRRRGYNTRTNGYRNIRTNGYRRNPTFFGVSMPRLQSPLILQPQRNSYPRGY